MYNVLQNINGNVKHTCQICKITLVSDTSFDVAFLETLMYFKSFCKRICYKVLHNFIGPRLWHDNPR